MTGAALQPQLASQRRYRCGEHKVWGGCRGLGWGPGWGGVIGWPHFAALALSYVMLNNPQP